MLTSLGFVFRRRVYLPSDLMAAHGVSAESVVRGRDTEDLRACAESVAARAQEHLESSRDGFQSCCGYDSQIQTVNCEISNSEGVLQHEE